MPQVIISAFDEEVERQQAGKKNKFTQDGPNIDFEKAKLIEKFPSHRKLHYFLSPTVYNFFQGIMQSTNTLDIVLSNTNI